MFVDYEEIKIKGLKVLVGDDKLLKVYSIILPTKELDGRINTMKNGRLGFPFKNMRLFMKKNQNKVRGLVKGLKL